ncbi:hypothetical protein PCANC_12065 [Puccinia coronata f. sp. avenae]|uniref:Uncharacterized protein n=1 Tax=Puccinia coronata f. sp. avenae TaxID=200324 RepID=A0A2N5T3K5_9BASI|nr:hypothetical protein PCANC_12065 [Puccinia coronata f. sp. avenae]
MLSPCLLSRARFYSAHPFRRSLSFTTRSRHPFCTKSPSKQRFLPSPSFKKDQLANDASSRLTSKLDQEVVSSQYQRFLEFYAQLSDAEERFQSFYNTAGLEGVQKHLDNLDRISTTLKPARPEFLEHWCHLLNRETSFKALTRLLFIHPDKALQEELSQLAFVIQYPTLSQNPEPDHMRRISAIDEELSSADKALYLPPRPSEPAIPLDPEVASSQAHFFEIHTHLPNPEEAFQRIYDSIELKDIQEHLNALDSLPRNQAVDTLQFKELWSCLLLRVIKFRHVVKFLKIKSDAGIQEQVSQLAFTHQHPDISRDRKLTHDERVKAIDADSLAEAKEILNSLIVLPPDPIVAEGFNHTYLNSQNIVDPILESLEEYAKDWSRSAYLAPYTLLIAPSMGGKTRLLKELSGRVCVVYICIRPLTSSGYPPRSQYASKILLDPSCKTLQTRYQHLLLCILHAVAEFFSNQKDTQTKQERLDKWIMHSFPQKGDRHDPPFWTEVEKKMVQMDSPYQFNSNQTFSTKIQNAMKHVTRSLKFLQQDDLRVILAIDEARELVGGSNTSTDMSFFRLFCRVLKNIPEATGFFSIVCDTTSRVANFNPPTTHDPSYRPDNAGRKLFAPIYYIPTFDVNVSDPPATWQELQSAFRLFSYGSPFWGVYADDARKSGAADSTIMSVLTQLALQKLLGCTSQESIPAASELTISQAIALLGCTIQPQLFAAAAINAELISSHAAQCTYIDESREMLISEYPSQFTLSSAANEYLARDDARLIRCIQVLTWTRQQGKITTGHVDEIVSRIILLQAMQETMKKTDPNPNQDKGPHSLTMPFGHSVRLVDFLETLTGLDRKDLNLGSITSKNRNKLLKNGRVFWNHFVTLDYTPSSANLFQQLFRGMAIQCKQYQKGFDQLFPIYLHSKSHVNLEEKNITICGIQVKNRKQTASLTSESHTWTPGFAGIDLSEPKNPYLVLYFSLGDSKLPETRAQEKAPEPTSSLSPLQAPEYSPTMSPPRKFSPTTSPPKSRPGRPKAKTSLPVTSQQDNPLSETLHPKIMPIPGNEKLSAKDSDQRASLAFYGLDAFPFLSPELIAALEELSDTHPNVRLLHEKSKSPEKIQNYFRQHSPQAYSPKVPS